MNTAAVLLLMVLMLAVGASPATAHEVNDTVSRAEATVVTLHYADGTPFAGETFELFAAGNDKPLLSGRTDARGRAVLLLEGQGPWRLRAFSDDGHGVERVINAAPAPASGTALPPDALSTSPDRNSRIVFGLGLLLALFGIIQLVQRRRSRR